MLLHIVNIHIVANYLNLNLATVDYMEVIDYNYQLSFINLTHTLFHIKFTTHGVVGFDGLRYWSLVV